MEQETFQYTVRESRRSRSLRVTVFPGGRVVVSVPPRTSRQVIDSFLHDRREWLTEKVAYFKTIPDRSGEMKRGKKLYSEYKDRAYALAHAKLVAWGKVYGFSFKKLSIRNSKTRWGSCSHTGTISINYKIVFLPELIADYLIVHELCHLKEHNHSASFWALVKQAIPEYELRRGELHDFEKTFTLPPLGI